MTTEWYVHGILQTHALPLMQRLQGAIFQQAMLGLTRQGCHKTISGLIFSFFGLHGPQICLQSSLSGIISGRRFRHPTSLNELEREASDEAHFWLNGYVNKQNCRIWSEANPQVYVETPLHPEKLTVWCALWAGGILLPKR
ncbi:hypothetical protein TNCV_4900051 [Trichonephila clavipes]|nr:hypothetical protein TNCV_4900051 [Trichonephila clavipes]